MCALCLGPRNPRDSFALVSRARTTSAGRHIEFANRYEVARGRLAPLERDLLRHVAWQLLGNIRCKLPSAVPAGPTDTCVPRGRHGDVRRHALADDCLLGCIAGAGSGSRSGIVLVGKRAAEATGGGASGAHAAAQAAYREAMTTMVRQQAAGQQVIAEQAQQVFRGALRGAQRFMQWAKGAMLLGQQAAYRDALQDMAQQQAAGQMALAAQTKRMFRGAMQSIARQQTEGQLALTGQQQQMLCDALQSMVRRQAAGQLALAGQQTQDAYQWIIKAVHGLGLRLRGATREGLAAYRSWSWSWSGECDR